MIINMICIGSTGDVRPYIALALELKKRGHDIGVCTFSDFKKLITEAGLRYCYLTGDAKLYTGTLLDGSMGIDFMKQAIKVLNPMIEPMLHDIENVCDEADVVISTYFGHVVRMIAEKCGVPYIQTQYFCMDENSSIPIPVLPGADFSSHVCKSTYRLMELVISACEKTYTHILKERVDLPSKKLSSRDDYMINGHVIPVLYAVSSAVMPRPKEWGENIHMTGYWIPPQETDPEPADDLRRFVESGDKPVVIGFGSMNGKNMENTMSIVYQAVKESGLRTVILSGWGGIHMESTERIFVTSYAPHEWLMPRAAGVVHHGGAGTTAAGLRAGAPTLIVPFGGDQPVWGKLVYEMGAGPKPIPREKLSVSLLRDALIDLVSHPEYKTVAEHTSAVLHRENGVKVAADIIERETVNWHRI